jgi:uncharacterized membrane protein YcgQ (UPF0703/DUF1980 family)
MLLSPPSLQFFVALFTFSRQRSSYIYMLFRLYVVFATVAAVLCGVVHLLMSTQQ